MKPRSGAAGPPVGPHPVQTVRAAEELLDELLVRQAGDVGGADGYLALAADGDGLVGGGEGLLLRCRGLLLRCEKSNNKISPSFYMYTC